MDDLIPSSSRIFLSLVLNALAACCTNAQYRFWNSCIFLVLANVGEEGDTAIFFGLSGTGKTTLSTDANRRLIGDDEHGWSADGVFNFEGGCYAKCINLSEAREPEIYRAIRHGAILENIPFKKGTRMPDYDSSDITQNTRGSYPLRHIDNIMNNSQGGHPQNVFFLTCDAFGVLPPIAKLTKEQAMYYFLLGYTAKVAGTETGVVEPQMTFSACFGAPFLPLAPTHYAKMLGEKMEIHNTNVWLVNTGWTGGSYGIGHRISLKYTRNLIKAVLQGNLAELPFRKEAHFDLDIPVFCTGVPNSILDPRNQWENKEAYDKTANKLLAAFEQTQVETLPRNVSPRNVSPRNVSEPHNVTQPINTLQPQKTSR